MQRLCPKKCIYFNSKMSSYNFFEEKHRDCDIRELLNTQNTLITWSTEKRRSDHHDGMLREFFADIPDELDKVFRVAIGHVQADVLETGQGFDDVRQLLQVTLCHARTHSQVLKREFHNSGILLVPGKFCNDPRICARRRQWKGDKLECVVWNAT